MSEHASLLSVNQPIRLRMRRACKSLRCGLPRSISSRPPKPHGLRNAPKPVISTGPTLEPVKIQRPYKSWLRYAQGKSPTNATSCTTNALRSEGQKKRCVIAHAPAPELRATRDNLAADTNRPRAPAHPIHTIAATGTVGLPASPTIRRPSRP